MKNFAMIPTVISYGIVSASKHNGLSSNQAVGKNQPYVIGKKTFDSEADFVKAAQSHLAEMGLDIIDPEYARELGIDFDQLRKKSDDYMKTLSALARHFQTDNMNTLSNRMHETETEIYNDIIMGKDYDKLFTLVSLHNDNLLSRFLEFVKDVAKNHSIDDDLYPAFLWMLIFHKNTNVALDFLKNYSFDVNFNISGKSELPDERLSSLLNIALMKGETNVILALLEFDELDFRASDLSIYLLTQEISLHGNSKVVKAIMNHASFDPNIKSDDNTTLLMVATKFNKLDIVDQLLKFDRIDLDLQDNKGNSALMYALKFGQDSILDLFFEHLDRINVNLENNKGISTLLFAILSLKNPTQSKLNIASKMLDYEYLNVNTFYKVGYPIHLVRNYNLDDLAEKIMHHNTFDASTLNYKADWDTIGNAVNEYWDQRKDVFIDSLNPSNYDPFKVTIDFGSYSISVGLSIFGLSTLFILLFALRNFRPLVYSIFQFFSNDQDCKDSWRLAKVILGKTKDDSIMCSSEFSRAAIDSNRIPNSIESLPMNSVHTLLDSESLNNQYLRELLLNRQANLNKDGECQKFLSKNLSDICKKITESSCQFEFFEQDDNVNQYIAIPQFLKFKAFKDSIERYRENQGKFNDLVSHCQNLVKKPTWDLEIFNEFREKFTELESEFNFGEVLLEEKIKNQSDYDQLINIELSSALKAVVDSLRSQINKIPPCETLTKTWELLYLFFDHQSKKEFKDIEKNKYYKNKRFSKDDIYNDFIKTRNYYKEIIHQTFGNTVNIGKMNQKNREFDAIYLKIDEFQLCSDSFEQAGYLKAYKTINDLIEYTKKRSELDRVVIKLVERQSEFYHLLNHLQSKLDVGLGVSPLTQLKDHLDSEYVIDESVDITGSVSIAQSSISSILRTKSSTVKPDELVKEKVSSFVNLMSPDYFPNIDDDEIINERNKMMGYMILFFLEEKENTKDLRKELYEMRSEDPELQATFTILNNRPHNDKQSHLHKKDEEKVLYEFKQGMAALNNQFFNRLKLSKINLNEAKIQKLSNLYSQYSSITHRNGSHYHIKGPYIIPSQYQKLSSYALMDRWIALKTFDELDKAKPSA